LLAEAGCDADASEAQIVIDHLEIARKLGSPLLRCVAGNLFTRDEGHDMTALADGAVSILREACRAAEEMGMKIAMENHADFTVRELAAILARVNSPAFGFTVDCANLAFDLDEPLGLAGIMAPYALTTHYKNYRVIRTDKGLALENCSLGDGDIDIARIARLLGEHNPAININIEIHSQFAPFRLDILEETFFQRHPSPPGEGLGWYLQRSWNRGIPEALPANLPDGEPSWELEHEHLKRSIAWAKENLSDILSE
jgi:sugar phosphate isomerase/epimerase